MTAALLMDAIVDECARCRRLLNEYDRRGRSGSFAAARIQMDLEAAESAIFDRDVVAMAKVYEDLKEIR